MKPNIIHEVIKIISIRTTLTFVKELVAHNKYNGTEGGIRTTYKKIDRSENKTLTEKETDFVLIKICEFVILIVSEAAKILTKKQKDRLKAKINSYLN